MAWNKILWIGPCLHNFFRRVPITNPCSKLTVPFSRHMQPQLGIPNILSKALVHPACHLLPESRRIQPWWNDWWDIVYTCMHIYIYNAANAAKQKTFVEKLPVNVLVSWIRDHQTPKPQKFHEVMLYQQGCGDELFFLIGSFRPAPLEHQIALHFRTPTTRLVQRPQPFTLKIVPHVARNVKKSHLS